MDIFQNRQQVDRGSCETFQHVEKSLFVDSQSADEYTCTICQAIVIDPYEHIPSPEINCDSIFCLVCAKQWITEKNVSCPAEGCLTEGFTLDSLRPLGTRETSRLSNLKVKCEFDCGEIVCYRDYFAHRVVCASNPSNVCQICETAKKEGHDCKTIFNLLRDWNKTLERENDQLKNEIVNLKQQLQDVRGDDREMMMKPQDDGIKGGQPGQLENEKRKKNRKSKKVENPREDVDGNDSDTVIQIPSQPAAGSTAGRNEVRDWLKGPVPQYKFHSNCVQPLPRSDRVCLYFHYAEKTFKIGQVEPSIRFRTVRSLLTDMMGHDPGQILFLQHRILKDHHTIGKSKFPRGSNDITFVPWDTPDYGEPGFQLSLYQLKDSNILSSPSKTKSGQFSSPVDELASGFLASQPHIKFFANNVESQPGQTQINLVLRVNGKSYAVADTRPEMNFGEIRRLVHGIIKKDPGRMMYLTYRVIHDDMTLAESDIPLGPTDLTLLSPNFPEKFEPGRSLQLLRFRNPKIMKSSASKFPQLN